MVGARSSDLAGQVDRALPIEPDVAVILIGANDVTHRPARAQSVRAPLRGRTPAPRRRRRGPGRHLPRPRHDQADRAAAQAGRPHLVAPAGRRADDRRRRGRRPDRLARLDPRAGVRRRPGAAVRARPVPPLGRGLPLAGRRAAAVDAGRARPGPRRGGGARGVPRRGRAADRDRGASRPSSTPGTELDGTEVAGRRRGVRGLWVELRHRRRQPQPEGEAPDDSRPTLRPRAAMDRRRSTAGHDDGPGPEVQGRRSLSP